MPKVISAIQERILQSAAAAAMAGHVGIIVTSRESKSCDVLEHRGLLERVVAGGETLWRLTTAGWLLD